MTETTKVGPKVLNPFYSRSGPPIEALGQGRGRRGASEGAEVACAGPRWWA